MKRLRYILNNMIKCLIYGCTPDKRVGISNLFLCNSHIHVYALQRNCFTILKQMYHNQCLGFRDSIKIKIFNTRMIGSTGAG